VRVKIAAKPLFSQDEAKRAVQQKYLDKGDAIVSAQAKMIPLRVP
jgi:hypothetical protein